MEILNQKTKYSSIYFLIPIPLLSVEDHVRITRIFVRIINFMLFTVLLLLVYFFKDDLPGSYRQS